MLRLALVATLLFGTALAQLSACNATFCSDRGTASVNSTGGCACACTWPYYGYRCLYAYSTNNTVNCNSTFYSGGQQFCESATMCYWNATNGTCNSRVSAIVSLNADQIEPEPWCANAFPLPFIMVVYAFATVAFGFCFVCVVYLGRYYDVYSRVEDSGERVFNQFYNHTAPWIVYSVIIVIVAGILAITSWINLNIPTDCTYVFFVWLYLIVQILPFIIVPLYYLIVWILKQCGKAVEIKFILDEHVQPVTTNSLSSPNRCQVRCH